MGALGLLMLLVCETSRICPGSGPGTPAGVRHTRSARRWLGQDRVGAARREAHTGTHGRHAWARPGLLRSPPPRHHRSGRLAQAARDHARAGGGRIRPAMRARDESAVRDGCRCRASCAAPHRERPWSNPSKRTTPGATRPGCWPGRHGPGALSSAALAGGRSLRASSLLAAPLLSIPWRRSAAIDGPVRFRPNCIQRLVLTASSIAAR